MDIVTHCWLWVKVHMQRLIGKQDGDEPHNPACTKANSNQLCIFGTQVKSRLSRWDHTSTTVICQATSLTLPADEKGNNLAVCDMHAILL
jgi:hypothetical protein